MEPYKGKVPTYAWRVFKEGVVVNFHGLCDPPVIRREIAGIELKKPSFALLEEVFTKRTFEGNQMWPGVLVVWREWYATKKAEEKDKAAHKET